MKIFKTYPRTFWIANVVELLERWAWYGVFMLLALYLTGSKDTGALGFSQPQKGALMGIITAFVYFAPPFTGAISDRVGYKKVLIFAFIFYALGYFMMAHVKSYTLVFLAFFLVGVGAGFFKPIVSATIAKTTNEKTSSIGFGIFYMMVNIGAFIGPIVASSLRNHAWRDVFYMAAIVILVNMFLVITLYKEPDKEKFNDTISEALSKIVRNLIEVFKDVKFLVFLVLIIGFWTMYNQLFYSLPIFIDHWVNTKPLFKLVYNFSPWIAARIGDIKTQTIHPEMITNLDALYIIFLQLFISSFVKRWKALYAMIVGIFIAAIGATMMFLTNNPFFVILAILVFSIGEMSSSPKITEYIGLIAPKNKKALYIGMSFLPVAGGNLFAGYISGGIFQRMADKYYLLKQYLISHGIHVPAFSQSFTKDSLMKLAETKLHMSSQQITTMLWNTYHPSHIWYIFTSIGMITVIGLLIYDKFILKGGTVTSN
jgi:dipeptide/tripeptide permease